MKLDLTRPMRHSESKNKALYVGTTTTGIHVFENTTSNYTTLECYTDENIDKWIENVPEVDWSKVPVDTKIRVRERDSSPWYNRHFAYFNDGLVHAFTVGRTSHTDEGRDDVTEWAFAEIVE